ncbi:MAG: PAS domain S-box protein, partial [Lacisediminimonas sp.]|nr:PAS domain S-box protein [Lacisediminimonas sp.]
MRNQMVEHYRSPSAENVHPLKAKKTRSPENWELVAASGLLVGSLAGSGQLPLTDQQQREVNAAVSMDSQIGATLAGDADVTSMHYVSATDFIYAAPSSKIDGFRFMKEFYQRPSWTQSLPASNPSRNITMNGPYQGHTGHGPIITIAKPVYDGDRFLGVVALDLNLAMLQRLAGFGESVGETMLVSEDYRVLVRDGAFDPELRMQPPLSPKSAEWLLDKNNDAWLSRPIVKDEFWLVHRVKSGELYWAAARDTVTTWLMILMLFLIAASSLARARLARDLRHSQKVYRLITENIDDVIWLMELPSRHFSYVSPSVRRMFGWRSEQIMDREMAATLDPDMYEKGHAGLVKYLDRIKAGDLDARHIT